MRYRPDLLGWNLPEPCILASLPHPAGEGKRTGDMARAPQRLTNLTPNRGRLSRKLRKRPKLGSPFP
jgi:hypothetical protein